MAIVNKIVNILILVAAIAAVVFSFFLFSKREKLINGWTSMSGAIQNTAKTLDDAGASGTTATKDLAADKLKLTNYNQLSQVLPKLKDNAQKIVTQRNELATSVQQAAGVLSITGIETAKLRSVVYYPQQKQLFNKEVREFRTMRDRVSNAYAETGRIFGASVNARDFNNADTIEIAVNKVKSAANDVRARRDTFANYIAKFCLSIGVNTPNLKGGNYHSTLEVALGEFRKHQQSFNQTRNLLAAEQSKTKRLNVQIQNLNNTVAQNKKIINSKTKEVDRLTQILSRDGTLELPKKFLTSKDKEECYKYVKAKITYIDKDYGFVTINIGKNFIFTQKYGIKDNLVHFPLEKGKVMTISRDKTFVGKLLVTKVDDNVSIGNLLDGKPEKYAIGDDVYFSDDDIKAAVNPTAKK